MGKQNDFMTNMLANPNFTISDFRAVGFNADNTSLESEETYANSDKIRNNPIFKKADGSFDAAKFHNVYLGALALLNNLCDEKFHADLIKQTSFHRDNIFAPVDLRRQGPDFGFIKIPNPDRESASMFRLGRWDENNKTRSELALMEKVLANPSEAYDENGNLDPSKAIWHDSPNDSWLTDFWDTRVFAQWDEDGEHIDPITGMKVKHAKGDAKLNQDGHYYYENLDGRDVYGRQVLNKMDYLTSDDSEWNKYDFFDSDGKDKSVFGTVMKNLALVGSMYIPYVGPAIAGMSVLTQAAGLFGTLGKMAVGSDSPHLSALEGWAKSMSRDNKSEYAQNNTWCWENFIGLVGDVMAQFKEQRFLFEKAPALFKGTQGASKANLAAYELALKEKYAAESKRTMEDLILQGASLDKLMRASTELLAIRGLKAQADMESYIKGYNKMGEIMSKAYMTGVTVADTYGEAKMLGASDTEATLLTLGYGAAEAALLNTGLGEWLFPELRYNKMHQEAIAKALLTTDAATKQLEEKLAKESLKRGVKEAKKEYAKRVFNIGYNAAKSLWTASESVGSKTIKNTFANASGEAFEEVSEELLADLSKGCFNVVNWLRGDDTKLEAFDTDWKNPNAKTNWGAMFDRYAMNFMGGFVGGGISGMSLDNIKAMANLDHMDFNQGMQLLIYMVRNGEANDFLKLVNKMTLGDKNLSGTRAVEQTEDGQIVWEYALDKNDTLDALAKRAINNQVLLIQGILSGNNIDISDDSFLKGLTTVNDDLRYAYLANSKTAGRYLQEFNTLSARIIDATIKLNGLGELKTDLQKRAENAQENLGNNQLNNLSNNQLGNQKPKKKTEAEKEEDAAETSVNKVLEVSKATREADKQRLKELLKEKLSLFEGEKKATFIRDALFEMTPAISDPLVKVSFILFAEAKSGKKFNRIDDDEKSRLYELYKNYLETELPENIHIASEAYFNAVQLASEVLRNQAETYNLNSLNELIQGINNFYQGGLGKIAESVLSPLSTPEDYVTQVQETQNKLNLIFGSFVNKLLANNNQESIRVAIAALYEDAVNRLQLAKAVGDTTAAQAAQVEASGYEKLMLDLIANSIAENTEQIVDPYIRQGFINSEVKERLKEVLDNANKNLRGLLILLDNQICNLRNATDPDEVAQRTTLEESKELVKNKRSEIIARIALIDLLQHSPILKSLEEFTLATTGQGLNITELLAKVENSMKDKRDNLEDYTFGKDLGDLIEEALRAINLYRIAIEGAKVDNGDADNMFGYNRTINNVNKALGIETEELAEIDSDTANAFILDLSTLRNKLEYVKKLNAINSGLKLAKLSRVSGRTSELLFLKVRQRLITAIPDDWEGKDALETTLSGLSLLNDIEAGNTDSRSLTQDKKDQLLKETLQMEDALYEFGQANADKLTNSDEIAKLLGLMEFLGNNRALLNEATELEDFDDGAFTWWLASRMAVKASSFYNRYAQIINTDPSNPKPIAPITPLELAIYTNYASIVNGDIFDTFFEAYKKRIDSNWASLDVAEKLRVMDSIYPDSGWDLSLENEDTINLHARSILGNSLRYSNIVFTEGIPGAGKTTGVYETTIKMLKKFHKDDGLLDNVIYVHGASKDSAIKACNTLGLDPSKAMSREEFMQSFVLDWVDTTKLSAAETGLRMELLADGTYRSSNKLIPILAKDAPTLILLDEATNFTLLDFDDMDKLAKEHGITILAAGDTDLSGVHLKYSLNHSALGDTAENLDIFSSNFIHSFKLGVSMRTANSLKSLNLVSVQAFIQDPENADDTYLKYCINNEGIFGDYIIEPTYSNDLIEESELEEGSELGIAIRRMLDTLKPGEKIGYIYDNEESPLYKLLTSEAYKDKVNTYEGNSAQGKEGQYFIIEMDEGRDNYYKDLYTAITRAEQGSIIVRNNTNLNYKEYLTSELELETIDEGLTGKSIIPFATARKKFLEENTEEGEIKFLKRKAHGNTVSTPSSAASQTAVLNTTGDLPQGGTAAANPQSGTNLGTDQSGQATGNSATPPATLPVSLDAQSLSKALSKAELDNLIAPLGLNTGDAIEFADGTKGVFKDLTSTDDGRVIFNYQDETGNDASKNWYEIVDPDTGTYQVLKYTPEVELLPIEPFTGENLPDDLFTNILDHITNTIDLEYYEEWRLPDFLPSAEWQNKHLQVSINQGEVATGFEWLRNGPALITRDADGIEYLYDIVTSLEEATNNNLQTPPIHSEEIEDLPADDTISAFDDFLDTPDVERNAENELERLVALSNLNNAVLEVVVAQAAENKRKPIDILFHSFNTFETGVFSQTNDDGTPILTGDDHVNSTRIDSVNGLINIDKKLGNSIRTLDEYTKMLGKLRSIFLDYSDINKLNSVLNDFMSDNFEITGVKTIFGFKSTFPGGEVRGNNYDTFYKHPDETYLFIGGELEPLLKHQKSIIATIGNNTLGDILELPLLIFSNPMSIIRSKIGSTYQFPALLLKWDAIDRTLPFNIRVERFINSLSTKEKVEYGTLVDLFRVYAEETGKNYYKITKRGNEDWTPAGSLKNLGPQLVAETKGRLIGEDEGEGVYEDPGFRRERKYITIDALAKNPLIRAVSLLLFSDNKSGVIIGSDGSPISINGNTKLLTPGAPFVLYSMSDSATANLWDTYVDQLEHPDMPKKVGLAYVLPPTVDVETYVDTIYNLTLSKNVTDLGNSVTAFRILHAAFKNPTFTQNVKISEGFKTDYITKVQELLDLIEASYANVPKEEQSHTLVNFLKLTVPDSLVGPLSGKKGVSYRYLLRGLIANLGYRSGRIERRGERNQHNIDLLKQVAEEAGLNKIYFHAAAAIENGLRVAYGLVFELELNYDAEGNPTWSVEDVNGKLHSYTMHAKIDSLVFQADPSLILTMILNDRKWKTLHPDIKRSAETAYVNHTLTISSHKLTPALKAAYNLFTKLTKLNSSLPTPTVEELALYTNELIKNNMLVIAESMNKDGIPCIYVENSLIYLNPADITYDGLTSIFGDGLTMTQYLNTDPFSDPEVEYARDMEGKVYFTMRNSNGDVWDVIVNSEQFEFTPKSNPSITTNYAINDSNFPTIWNATTAIQLLAITRFSGNFAPISLATNLAEMIAAVKDCNYDLKHFEKGLRAFGLQSDIVQALIELKKQLIDEKNEGKDNCDVQPFTKNIA